MPAEATQLSLRNAPAVRPGRELPACAGAEARRRISAAARQCRAAVGDDAGGDEARRRGDPRHHAADAGRTARPVRSRPRRGWWWLRRSGRKVCRPRRRQSDPHRHRRDVAADGWHPLRGALPATRLRARRPDQCRRSDAAVFHLGHDGETETGAAQPAELSRWRAVDDVLARPAARRRASEHLLAGLGQACLELLVRALECRRHRVRGQSAALRRQGAARRPSAAAASPRCARRRRCGGCSIQEELADLQGKPARGLRGRRAAQPGSDRRR